MIKNKYLFIFAITVFILLSITGPGIFLNDEWIVGQQLNQLSQGHQITYNEGKYAYYMNGTPNNYMGARKNLLFYPMSLPLISLPIHLLFTLILTSFYARFIIILLWAILGIYCWYNIKDGIISNISIILLLFIIVTSMALYVPFSLSGKYDIAEVLSIGFTNILIMGIFSVIAFKLSELLFDDKNKQIVGWIASLSCTSLLFWAGTLKDHVLLSTIIILLSYCYIYYLKYNNNKYLIFTYILAGISVWIRPEVGIFVIIFLLLFNFIYIQRNILFTLNELVWVFIATLPFFINNYIVTGDILKVPFLMSQTTSTTGSVIEKVTNTTFSEIQYATTYSYPLDVINIFFSPLSGSLGLIVPLCLFIFSLITIIKYRQKLSVELKFLLTIGISSIIYYIIYAGTIMQSDGGIVPDIRYFTPAYSLLVLFALSIIPYKLNYKNIIKNIFIYLPIILIISLLSIATLSIGETYKTFRILPEIISTITLALMIIVFINDKTTNPVPKMEKLVPLAIVSPLVWQFIMIFVYNTSKLHYYPIFIPLSEYLFKIMFGG